jgi:hypothetical protein
MVWFEKDLKRKTKKKENLPHLTFRPNSPAAHLTSPAAVRHLFFLFFFLWVADTWGPPVGASFSFFLPFISPASLRRAPP